MPRRRSIRSRDLSTAAVSGRGRESNWPQRAIKRASEAALVSHVGFEIEPLEKRTLMTTVDAIGTTGSFLFYTGQDQIGQVTYNDVDFEAIAAFFNPTTGGVALGDPVPASTPEPALGGNIYKIYVTESNPDSYITIETINNLMAQAPTPFTGDIPAFAGINAQNGQPISVTTPGGTGGILIGALDTTTKPIANTPIDGIPLGTNYGLQPEPVNGILNPGIEVIPTNPDTGLQNDFGNFFVGGTVTGAVSFGGNLNEFYAGAVYTGDIGGDFEVPETYPTGLRTAPDNFHVAGDLREFVTTGPVGTNAVLTKVGDPSSIQYNSSFDLSVGGKLGEVHIGNAFAGTIEAGNSPYVSGQLSYPAGITPLIGNYADQTEVESPPPQGMVNLNFIGGAVDPATGLPLPPELDIPNDTLAEAQILGSIPEVNPTSGLPIRDADNNIIYQASVDGTLDNEPPAGDNVDTYAVGMLAGETFQVKLTNTTISEITGVATVVTGAPEAVVEVIDPDGRVIASDIRSSGEELAITTDRPGLYRFQVTIYNFHGATLQTALDYNLTISNVGNMGIGGIFVAQDYSDIGVDSGIIVGNGDLGAIDIGDTYVSTTGGPAATVLNAGESVEAPLHAPTSILVADGNLRVFTATSIGSLITGFLVDGPYLSVPNGSVGLLRSTGTGGTNVLVVQTQFDPNYMDLPTPRFVTDDLYASAIGGFIQKIDSATTLLAQIGTNAGIGTIDAANMATLEPSYIDVNADNTGNDGIIDLVDVPGQFGLLGGGPEFVTNTGGNIRYLNVGGPIFLPSAFGGQPDVAVTFPAGASNTFTDDSGAQFTATPNGPLTTVTINNSNGTTTTQTTGPQITSLTYPVLDKAGLVPISITSSGSMTINGLGINGGASSVDVANLSITGIGRPITTVTANSSTGIVTTPTDPNGNSSITQAVPAGGELGIVTGPITDTTDEFLSITGPAKFNVLNITATTSVAGNSPVEIANTTRGEVVNLTSPGLGQLIVNGNLGFATPVATAAAVLPRAVIADGNTYPFVQQHTGVVFGTGFVNGDGGTSAGTTGDVVSITVGGAAGNIEAGGTIQSLIANSAQSSGQKNAGSIPGQFDGIVGPILATRLLYVDVGQGLLPTGTGLVGESGLYGTGKIGTVTNAGNLDSDIRGNIISAEDDVSLIGIDAITIGDGSIIGSTIETIADNAGVPQFIESSDISPIGGIVKENNEQFPAGKSVYTYDIGPVTVLGSGGILGSQFSSGSFAAFTVGQGGFGILSTLIDGQNNGRIGAISASGYGIRDTTVNGIGYLGPVIASGNGGLIPVTAYPLDVRPSDVAGTVDPYFGITPSSQIDLNAALGTTAAAPNIANVTDTGVIENDIFNGENDFAGIIAQKARTTLPLFNSDLTEPIPPVANVPVIGTVFGNSVTFGGTVGDIKIAKEVDGFQLTAGRLLGLSLSSSVSRLGISVAGAIAGLQVRGNLGSFYVNPATGENDPDSYISAGGPDGTIGALKVFGNLNANIYATGQIGSITVTGDLLGSVSAYGLKNGLALNSLHVLGGVRDGSLVLNGSVGSIIVNGTFGTSAGSLSIAGNANLIEVGAGRTDKNADLALDLFVAGTLKSLKVFGQITGTVHTGIDLTHLAVTGTGATPNIITGNINVDGRLGTASVINGNVDSDIVVTGAVSSFIITRGSLLAGGSLQSQLNSINVFKTTGGAAYGMYGSLIALNGTNENIDISGNVGDGVDAAAITANSGKTFHIRGNVANNANIGLQFYLDLLRVDGSVLTGATISAHPLKVVKITGVNDGDVTVV